MSSTAEGGDWICVRTQPRREKWAKENIERHGLPVLLPMLREEQPHKEPVLRPLFPSYLFTLIQGQWYFLFSTFGVLTPVMRDGAPEVVPFKVIKHLQAHLDKAHCIKAPRLGYRKGQRLHVKRGPFEGLVGCYDGMSPQQRVLVLLELFGRQVRASVSVRDVAPLAA